MSTFRVLRATALSICLFLVLHQIAAAQSLNLLSGEKPKSADAPTQSPDPLKRSTPRSSIYQFLEACHQGKLGIAAQYLDLHRIPAERRAVQGPKLATELAEVLNRNPHFEVRTLSDSPEGNTADGLAPNIDELATFELNGEPVTLQLQRVNLSGAPVWLISSPSVAEIPELYGSLGANGIEKYLPAPLVNIRFVGTPLWIWLALVLIALVLSAISKWLSLLFIAALKPVTHRYSKSLQTSRLEALTEPLRLLLSVIVFRALMAFVAPSAILRDYLLNLLILLFALGAASLLMRLVDVVSDTIISRLDHRERALTYSIFPLGIRFVKICVFCFAVLFALQQWGYNTSAILAGVGVGGVAVALAAQKTIENLFGGISLISDRPVLVGDFCQFGGQLGTVEDIGLRSTRIRTLDRTVVTVPNSQFSTMTLENFSKRDRMWFHPTIRLRRDTRPRQITEIMEAVSRILEQHEKVDAAGVPVRFTKITEQSLDLEIFAYVLTPDSNEYLKIQTELLLQILEAATGIGVGFAVPFQEAFNVTLDPADMEGRHPYLGLQDKKDASSNDGARSAQLSEPRA